MRHSRSRRERTQSLGHRRLIVLLPMMAYAMPKLGVLGSRLSLPRGQLLLKEAAVRVHRSQAVLHAVQQRACHVGWSALLLKLRHKRELAAKQQLANGNALVCLLQHLLLGRYLQVGLLRGEMRIHVAV
jgi:hypothetical protein